MTEEQLHDKIKEWHNSNSELTIYEYLGWTREEYARWIETCEMPDRITPP